jgi:hypothetical protein
MDFVPVHQSVAPDSLRASYWCRLTDDIPPRFGVHGGYVHNQCQLWDCGQCICAVSAPVYAANGLSEMINTNSILQ